MIGIRTQRGSEIAAELPQFSEAVRQHDGVSAFNEATLLDPAARTAAVARDDGTLVGLALGHLLDDGEIEVEIAVAPDHRRSGIGSRLLDAVADQATASNETAEHAIAEHSMAEHAMDTHAVAERDAHAQTGTGNLVVWAHGDLPAAAALARSRGMTRARILLQLERPLDDGMLGSATSLPDGSRIRPFDPARDADVWVELNARIFADHPEQGAITHADLDARREQPWFRDEDFLILESGDGRMLGYNWLKVTPEEAEIYVLGVDPGHAGHGYGQALMAAGFARLRQLGAEDAVLYVDGDNTRAVDLYRRLGFVDRAVDVQYRQRPA